MTTFVPLSQDTEGAVSSAALGDWILSIIKVRAPSRTADYYSKLLNQFQEVEGEQVIKDSFQLFELLLSGHEMVFGFLQDAKDNGETALMTVDSASKVETEVQIKYVDAIKQVEEYFTVLMYMLQLRFTSNAQIEKAGNLLLRAISMGDSFVDLRLKLLQMLYNSVDPTLALRVVVYIEVLEFAAKHELFHTLIPVIQKIDDWMKDWALDRKTKIYIYRMISEQLDKMGKDDMAYEFFGKCIECCDVPALFTPENIKAAAEFCIRSIKADDVLYFDRLRVMPAVQHLANTEYSLIIELLDLFIQGSESDLDAIVAKHGEAAFESFGIPVDLCRSKIKLLTLASLCQNEPELPIARIQQMLNISRDDAEELVVTAITKGVMDGLIDQKSGKVIIRSVMQRQFQREQLQQLHSNLLQWKNCVNELIAVLSSNN
ncbi:Eukaryotic translation initiation factor 3 subunit M [Babesia sp. Xinjiang]|uniref:Eukaryotic translation initiation factor 3 subunit M n=1 Tax=Babesia sp. Xinjiang TaxID=462227 RepID=UPI000A25D1F2|nr:Eukaryotic translation initiation factor 3 subunit M [Babesia sp. Xinjiang]ORM41474.1 Eukaryotic translation initiation factor 3 subunit M [Babesia sp. Xinjiang]